jgi:hypothetical protein
MIWTLGALCVAFSHPAMAWQAVRRAAGLGQATAALQDDL